MLKKIFYTAACLSLITSGAAFANKDETLPSGVKITYLVKTEGKKPTVADTIKVNYTGRLENGRVFDSSSKTGGPVEFPLNYLIDCWKQAIPKMSVGSKALLTCPSTTAYGANAMPGIPANSTLVFEMELLDIVGKR